MRIIPNLCQFTPFANHKWYGISDGSSSTRCMLLLALMAMLISFGEADDRVEAIALPVDVGDIPTEYKKAFGTFPEAFLTCGKHQTVKLNPSFADAGKPNMVQDVLIHCEPEPGYVIKSDDDVTLDDLDDKSLLKQCQGLLACTGADYRAGADSATEVFDSLANKNKKYKLPARPQSICGKKALGKKGKTIIANENDCFSSGKHGAVLDQVKGESVTGAKFSILPRWLGSSKQFNLGHRRVFRTPVSDKAYDNSLVFGFDNEVAVNTKEYKQCDRTCNQGKSLKFTFLTGQWRAMVYLNNKCPSFRICLDPTNFGDNTKLAECKTGSHWDILVHAGSVVWPDHLGGSVIKLRPDLPVTDASSGIVAVEIGYGVKVAKTEGELFVGNVYREFVMSDSQGIQDTAAAHISMHFPMDDCLAPNGGVVSANIKEGRTYVDKTITVIKHSEGSASGGNVDGTKGHHAVTETPVTTPASRPRTTTAPPPGGKRVTFAEGRDSNKYGPRSAPMYQEGKWWTWALYIGSILGTVLIMLPGTALFYVLRRTVFAVWYRGMYKRYGCDASGTTGGITGVGFSDTTTGGITVGGTTGGTTGGGTTGGGTTGGDTTGADTTKTNTLAL